MYALPSSDDVSKIAELASRVIMYWREVCARDERPFPFAGLLGGDSESSTFSEPTVQKVIELGSVIVETVQYGMPLSKNERVFANLARYVARHDSDYTRAWMRSEIISEYCEANGVEYKDALPYVTPTYLKLIALQSNKNPEKRIAQMIEQFNKLTPKHIAAATGWSEDEVNVIFTPAKIMDMCKQSANDPLKKIKGITQAIDTEYTPQKIAVYLGWSDERTEIVFPRNVILRIVFANSNPLEKIRQVADHLDTDLAIKEIATRHGADPRTIDKIFTQRSLREIAMGAHPLRKVGQIVDRYHGVFSVTNIALALNISEERTRAVFTDQARIKLAGRAIKEDDEYARARAILQTASELEVAGIPTRIATYLARMYSQGEAKAKADIVIRDLDNKPPHTSDLLWMWAITMNPHGSRQQRLEALRMRKNWFNITSKWVSIDPQSDWRFDEYAKDHSIIPAPMSTDPTPALRELGKKAGVSSADLKQLLLFFADSDSCELDNDMVSDFVTRMQAVSKDGQ